MKSERAIIFVNGVINDIEAARAILQPTDYLVAADGGWHHLRRMNLLPVLLVGDMDSLSSADLDEALNAGVTLQGYPVDKDETDLELALRDVLNEGYRTIRIVAALGGRLDQTLGNIFLLTQPALANCDVRLDDGHEEVFIIRHKVTIEGHPGDTVSLLPLGEPARCIITEGLRYPLRAEILYPERTRGISNVMLETHASIEIGGGMLLCVHSRR